MAEIIRLDERRTDEAKARVARKTANEGGDAEILLFTGVQYQRLDAFDGNDHANRPARRSGGKGKKH